MAYAHATGYKVERSTNGTVWTALSPNPLTPGSYFVPEYTEGRDAGSLTIKGSAAAIDSVKPLAQAKGVLLEASIEAEAGPVVGDADRLQQVIWNLLTNAIKFTPSGGGVTVSSA